MTTLFPNLILKCCLTGAKQIWGQRKWDRTLFFFLSVEGALDKGANKASCLGSTIWIIWLFVLLLPVFTRIQVGKVVLCSVS